MVLEENQLARDMIIWMEILEKWGKKEKKICNQCNREDGHIIYQPNFWVNEVRLINTLVHWAYAEISLSKPPCTVNLETDHINGLHRVYSIISNTCLESARPQDFLYLPNIS